MQVQVQRTGLNLRYRLPLRLEECTGKKKKKKDKYTDVLIKVELLPLPPTSLAPRAITVMRTSHLFPNT